MYASLCFVKFQMCSCVVSLSNGHTTSANESRVAGCFSDSVEYTTVEFSVTYKYMVSYKQLFHYLAM